MTSSKTQGEGSPTTPKKRTPARKAPAKKKARVARKPATSAKKSYVEKVFTWFNPSQNKARLIAERYVADYNPYEALKAGGYSDSSIASHGHVIIQHPRIVAEVEKLQAEIRERVIVDETYVIEGLKSLADRCLGRAPVVKLDEDGNTVFQLTFNPSSANKALESIGRHLGMFKDVLEVREELTVEEWVSMVEKDLESGNARAH